MPSDFVPLEGNVWGGFGGSSQRPSFWPARYFDGSQNCCRLLSQICWRCRKKQDVLTPDFQFDGAANLRAAHRRVLVDRRQPMIGKRRLAANSSSPVCIACRTYASTSAASGCAPNCAAMWIGASTWMTILVGSGRLTGTTMLSPNGKPNVMGRTLECGSWSSRRAHASRVPRDRNSWFSCAPTETIGTMGTAASMAVRA
ncbi:hypothetical protein LAUMK35_03664 [Mycobacterium pseudokansasii]|nr:hypothetical protein LAUMK35_03664 [Mycobacterium pseudokansasii]VAZ98859.1 hypothetical protein LAUMK21_03661 [Mycobacterium pseudokansasii]